MRLKNLALTLLFMPISTQLAQPSTTLDRLQSLYATVQDWRADFDQETSVKLLNRTIRKKGKILMKKGGFLRIEYGGTDGRLYVGNGKKLWVYTAGDREVLVYKNMNKLMSKEALSFLKGLGDIMKDFETKEISSSSSQTEMFKNRSLSFIELIPKKPSGLIESIILGVDPKSSLVKETSILNTSGNQTHYLFHNIALNSSLNDKLFEFKKDDIKEITP